MCQVVHLCICLEQVLGGTSGSSNLRYVPPGTPRYFLSVACTRWYIFVYVRGWRLRDVPGGTSKVFASVKQVPPGTPIGTYHLRKYHLVLPRFFALLKHATFSWVDPSH